MFVTFASVAIFAVLLVEFYAVCLAVHYSSRCYKGVYIDKYGYIKAFKNPEGQDGTTQYMFWTVYQSTSVLFHDGYSWMGYTDKRFSVMLPGAVLGVVSCVLAALAGGASLLDYILLFTGSIAFYAVGFCVAMGKVKYGVQKKYFNELCDAFQEVYYSEVPKLLPSKK